MQKYIYNYPTWPHFRWSDRDVQDNLGQVRFLQGKIMGQMASLGFSARNEALLSTLTTDAIKSSEIEGEKLNYDSVRSSLAKRLGIEVTGFVHSDRFVEGVVEMLIDATQNYQKSVTHERLFGWHAALFPTGWSGIQRIHSGNYRTGEIQIVSGSMGKEKIHYEAPSAKLVFQEMEQFLEWVNGEQNLDGVLKAAIGHFWFIIIHPFEDGNGRIARALTDLMLARSENTSNRYYSMSNQKLAERKNYYSILQQVQHSEGDITEWIIWFLQCLFRAMLRTDSALNSGLKKVDFWEKHKETPLNSRQRLVLNKILDGFEGKLTTSKWARLTKSSSDTALRDIRDLMAKGILIQDTKGGRSTNYLISGI